MKKIKGYKAFNKNLTCRGFKFEVGKEYKHNGDIELCEKGFHFCENPLDILDFYDLTESEFAEVEAIGKTKSDDKKIVTDKIKINSKIDLPMFIKASFDFLWKKCNEKGLLENTKEILRKASSGYNSKLASSGDYSIIAGIGIGNIAKGIKGNWIVLAEYNNDYKPKYVKTVKIDGKKIKENIYYKLENNKFVEVK